MNVDPRGFSHFRDWAEATVLPLSRLVLAPVPESDIRWKEWGLAVIQISSLSKYNPPDPRAFEDWHDWATRFNQAVPL